MRTLRPNALPLGLATCLLSIWMLNWIPASTAIAQTPVRYVLHEVPLQKPGHEGTVNSMNQTGLVVGYHFPSGVKTGYVYDHYGLLGLPGMTHDVTEWIEVPGGWNASCVGVNDLGQIVGLFETTTSLGTERVGYLLDLDIFSATPIPTWRFLPSVPGAISSYGRRINNNGQVLIEAQGAGGSEQYLYNSNDIAADLIALEAPSTYIIRYQDLNDNGQLCGAVGGSAWRLTPGIQMLEVPGALQSQLNEFGELALNLAPIRDRRGRIITPGLAARYRDEHGLETLSTVESVALDINDSGDICGYNGSSANAAVYTDEHGWVYFSNTVEGTTADVEFWSSSQNKTVKFISNRNASGFGNVYAVAVKSTTSGKGKSAVTTTVVKHFLLEPTAP